MKKFLVVILAVGAATVLESVFVGAPSTAEAGGGEAECSAENGDIDADGEVNITDAITVFGYLFLGDPTGLLPVCTAPAGPFGLPDSSQTNCYDEVGEAVDCTGGICPGQDGAYATGCPTEGRFTDNGDGTVTDHCTGLVWQKDTGNNGNRLTWCDALAYCENLALAGHDDWRLPNVLELQSIVDYGRFRPALDPVFRAFPADEPPWAQHVYWSSTSYEDSPEEAWFVNFEHGSVQQASKDRTSLSVRAVRSGKCARENGDVNADGEVNITDAITILGHLFLSRPTELVPLCATPVAPSGLPDTGQKTCYDEVGEVVDCAGDICAGQDGAYATGCPTEGRFTDNRDGTVTDHCTGLMWQKDTGNDGTPLIWCDALAYCEDLEFAGHDDWRLPNVLELQSIVDHGRFSPAIDPVFGAFSSFYWSSVTGEPEQLHQSARDVQFINGDSIDIRKHDHRRVRAVRSGK